MNFSVTLFCCPGRKGKSSRGWNQKQILRFPAITGPTPVSFSTSPRMARRLAASSWSFGRTSFPRQLVRAWSCRLLTKRECLLASTSSPPPLFFLYPTRACLMNRLALFVWPSSSRELPRPVHWREGLWLQGLPFPPCHPPVHVPGMTTSAVIARPGASFLPLTRPACC